MKIQTTNNLCYRVDTNSNVIIWNRLYGNPLFINKEKLNLLLTNNFKSFHHDEIEILEKHQILLPEYKDNSESYYKSIDNNHYINYSKLQQVNSLMIELTNLCNFECSYCMHKKVTGKKLNTLSINDIKKSIHQINNLFAGNQKLPYKITFTGGEPLLKWNNIKRVVEFLNKTTGYPIKYRILTNGSLIDENIAFFLKNNDFTVHLSIDGIDSVHNNNRPMINNNSYQCVKNGISILNKYDIDIGSVGVTITNNNINHINNSFIDYIKNCGVKHCSIEPDLTARIDYISIDKLAQKLVNIMLYAKQKDIIVKGFWNKPYVLMFQEVNENEKRISWCGATSGVGLVISSNAKWKVCPYLPFEIGNLDDDMDTIITNWSKWALSYKKKQRNKCNGCLIESFCMGGCIVNQYYEGVTDFRCELYNKAFNILIDETLKTNTFVNA